MKKIYFDFKDLFLILTIFLFSFSNLALASQETIKDFNAYIKIQSDGAVLVTERIVYDFGDNKRHGIIRFIPLTSPNGPDISIEVLDVFNDYGNPYKYTTYTENNKLVIKIGDPDVFISGVNVYNIHYKVFNAIRFFEDHDELYWNVTGNEWQVNIQNAKAFVSLPSKLSINELKGDCFTGYKKSAEKACVINLQDFSVPTTSISEVTFNLLRELKSNEGLTIVVGFPPGIVTYSSTVGLVNQKNLKIESVLSFIFILAFIFVFFIAPLISIIRKNKPQIPPELKNRPIVIEYNPPENLTPIDAGAIFDGNLDDLDLYSVIIDLAVKGYLKIKYIGNDDYEFIKLKDLSDFDHPAYKIIFNFLFVTQNSIKLSELEYINAYLDKERIINEMQNYLQSKGYLQDLNNKNPSERKYYLSRYIIIILSIFVILYVFLFVISGGFQKINLIGMLFLAILCGFFSILIGVFIISVFFDKPIYSNLTPLGIKTLGMIIGFK
jgi:hypothetical protein